MCNPQMHLPSQVAQVAALLQIVEGTSSTMWAPEFAIVTLIQAQQLVKALFQVPS